jgi:copper chaperone CopZ
VEGVQRVAVDIPSRQVTVAHDEEKVSIDRLKEVLQEEDYPVESVAAG